MSIVILGSTCCAVCGQTLDDEQTMDSYPAFVWDESDPLFVFSDASVHSSCMSAHPQRVRVQSSVAEMMEKTGPGKRKCAVCEEQIMDPLDHVLIPRLTGEKEDPLYRFNYTHLHGSHVGAWGPYEHVVALLRRASTNWKGPALTALISDLEKSNEERDPHPE